MALFLRILEWNDESRNQLVYKLPLKNEGREINHKSKLIVREGQQAIFVHKGQICDVFEPGTYNMNTEIFPILSKLAGWKYGFQTPIIVDVFFIKTTQIAGIKWGTKNPILMRDPEFGAIRVRGFGSFAYKVHDAGKFMKELFGTNSSFLAEDINDWLTTILLSGITDALGESKVSALDLAGNTLEFNEIVKFNVQEKFKEYGLKLTNLVIENMSVPPEVEKAIDERSKLGILGDKTDVMMKIAAADAMRDAAKNTGMGGAFMGAGVGLGAGAGVGAMFADAMRGASETSKGDEKLSGSGALKSADKKIACPKCNAEIPATAKFCPECGEKLAVKKFCAECGAEVSAKAKFCPECGTKF